MTDPMTPTPRWTPDMPLLATASDADLCARRDWIQSQYTTIEPDVMMAREFAKAQNALIKWERDGFLASGIAKEALYQSARKELMELRAAAVLADARREPTKDEPEALVRLIRRSLDLNDHPDSMQGDDDGPAMCHGCLTLANAILAAGYRRAALPVSEAGPTQRREVVEQPRQPHEELSVGFNAVEREARFAWLQANPPANCDPEDVRGWARVTLVQEAYRAGQRRFYGPLCDALDRASSAVAPRPQERET